MSVRDRLRDLRYTSPSGATFTLEFDSLSRSGGKKAPVTEFPGQDQGAVEDLGNLTPRFPVTCYISGTDYDQEADRFWDALHERGFGFLEHPRFGNFEVLALPSTQTEQFVDGAGRAVFEIEFVRVTDEATEYPRIETVASDRVIELTQGTAAQIIGSVEGITIESEGEKATLKDNILSGLDATIATFDNLTGITSDIAREIDSTVRGIQREIDTLVESPALLLGALLNLYRLPGRIEIDLREKINGYRQIYSDMFTGFRLSTFRYGERLGIVNSQTANAIQAAAAEASTAGTLPTRNRAISAVDELNGLSSTVSDGIEQLERLGRFSADHNSRIRLSELTAEAVGSLISRAVSLPSERVITLDRNETPIELCYRLDGSLDRLDFFIEYNELSGTEILMIPTGRQVRWYA